VGFLRVRKLISSEPVNQLLFFFNRNLQKFSRKTESRLKTFELLMSPGDVLPESKIDINELAQAGYVR